MRIVFYLVVIPLSKMPFWVLYGLSNLIYAVVYYVVGYRKSTVRTGIRNSFPEKTSQERLKTEREFYRHFADLIVESIKAFTISEEEIRSRFNHPDISLFEKYLKQGRHIAFVGGHYGNWELFAVSVGLSIPHQPVALYTPLQNKFMDAKMQSSRSKFGLLMRSYKQVKEMIIDPKQKPMAVIFGADQCPRLSQKPHWMEFLNQETGVQVGAEKFAKDFNAVVIYGLIKKVKRGHFEMEYRLITDEPQQLPWGRITELHTLELEKDIRNKPPYWLWTHKRWKRKRADFENK
ncbi:MAG: lysophospholipid acyltransferase family protein [Cyclobacteriaceae bacterium]|nr:lysophospholipid acyltransferase family protein [Cyclobacteriaceae bacterium]